MASGILGSLGDNDDQVPRQFIEVLKPIKGERIQSVDSKNVKSVVEPHYHVSLRVSTN